MRIIKKRLEITEEEPFKHCLFERQYFAEGLTNLFEEVDHPLTVSIDAAWGEGKSTFAKMWKVHLKNKGIPVIHFDAFENDRSGDAFLALSGQIISASKKAQNKKQDTATENFKANTIKLAKTLAPAIGKAGVRVITAGLADGTEADEFITELGNELSGEAGSYIKERLAQFEESENERNEFKKSLTELVRAITSDKPLIVLIDELDRCRPPYALSVLETVKHLFEAENVVFVFFVNEEQLKQHIVHQYGGTQNSAKVYLEKFFFQKFVLPKPKSGRDGKRQREKIVKKVFHELNISLQDSRHQELLIDFVVLLANQNELSIRAIERIATDLAICTSFMPQENQKLIAPIVAILSSMRALDTALYEKARRGVLSIEEAYEFCGFEYKSYPEKFQNSSEVNWIKNWLRFCLDRTIDITHEGWSDFGGNGFWDVSDRFDYFPEICSKFVDVFPGN